MKKLSFLFIILIMILYFILDPSGAIEASRRGLSLWFTQLLPTLLPFSILSYVVLSSQLFSVSGNKRRRVLPVGGRECYVLLCGFLFGFPIGSKLSADLYREGQLSRKNAMILCCFANNLSPMFAAAAMKEMLGLSIDFRFYLLLYGIPLVISILALVLWGEQMPSKKNTASRFHLDMQIVDAGILNGFETLLKICGYIIMFSILSELIKSIPMGNAFWKLILIGGTEVTNGIAELSAFSGGTSAKYLLAVAFLSFNGISGLFQTASIFADTDLSLKHYLTAKLLLVLLITGTTAVLLSLGLLI